MKRTIYLQILVAVSLVAGLLTSCSAERKCQRAVNRAKKLGCLKTDSIIVRDTFVISDYDTLVKFDTINEVDTLYAENNGIKTVIFTKWKTREVRVVQTGDTVIRERRVPEVIIKNTDCPKQKWWDKFWIGSFIGLLVTIYYTLKQIKK